MMKYCIICDQFDDHEYIDCNDKSDRSRTEAEPRARDRFRREIDLEIALEERTECHIKILEKMLISNYRTEDKNSNRYKLFRAKIVNLIPHDINYMKDRILKCRFDEFFKYYNQCIDYIERLKNNYVELYDIFQERIDRLYGNDKSSSSYYLDIINLVHGIHYTLLFVNRGESTTLYRILATYNSIHILCNMKGIYDTYRFQSREPIIKKISNKINNYIEEIEPRMKNNDDDDDDCDTLLEMKCLNKNIYRYVHV